MSFPLFGKEQELLDAARTGNLHALTRLLTPKSRKSGVPGAFGQKLTSFLKSVNVNCTDKNNYTPLHHAAVNGHRDVVEALLRADAQPGLKDNQGCTPVHLAAWSGKPEIVYQLLEVGTDSEAGSSTITPVHVNQQNNSGDTALHCAAQYGHVAVVDVLLQKNSNPTIRNLEEESPLDLASQYGHLEVVQRILISHPGLAQRPLINHSPLHLAASNGHRDIVEVLLDNGFSVHTVMEAGTALHVAALHGKLDVVRVLLDRGVDIGERDARGMTVLELLSAHQAQQKSFTEVVHAIKDHEARQSSEGVYESLAQCHSGGKPTAAVRPLPPEKPIKPEKPLTPDKAGTESPKSPNRPTPAPRNSMISVSPDPSQSAGDEDSYSMPVKDRPKATDSVVSSAAGGEPAPPPLPPRSSIFPPEDRTSVSPTPGSPKQDKKSPEPSPRSHQGVPKKPPRHKPPRHTTGGSPVGSTSPNAEHSTQPTNSIPPPPAAHKPQPPFPDLYSHISDQPTDSPDQSQTTTQHSKPDNADSSASIPKPDQSHDMDSHSGSIRSSRNASHPATSPKPSLPARTQSAKLDNSVDPQTGRQVNQDFYMEMKAVEVKPRPVSEVKPQRHTNIAASSDDSKVDHYGILYPNFKKDSPKTKRPELRRTHTAPEESVYVEPSPKSAVDKFKDKHGMLRRANTAPEESEYTVMNALKRTDATDVKENEYAEIPEGNKSATSPKSPVDNVYATITDTKAAIEKTMFSQISEFSSTVSQSRGGNSPTAERQDETKDKTKVSGKPNNLPFSEQKTNSTPLTPTGYAQPPTPDFPPPSPATAMLGIELKIQEMDSKRKSRDITTLTDDSLTDFQVQSQNSRSDEVHEVKVGTFDRSSSHLPHSTGEAVIEEVLSEETEDSGDTDKTAEVEKDTTTTAGDITKASVVAVIKSEVTESIPESSIPDIAVIKTESRVSIGDRTELAEPESRVSIGDRSELAEPVSEEQYQDTEDNMFGRKKSAKITSDKKDKDKEKGENEAKKPAVSPKRSEKPPPVMSKPSQEVVQKFMNESKETPAMPAAGKELVSIPEDGKTVPEDAMKTAGEANGAISQDSPVMMRKKSEPDMFAGLKRGSTIGVPPKARSTFILQNAATAGHRQSRQAGVKPGASMDKDEDIDFEQVLIEASSSRTASATDSMSFDDAEEWAKIADIISGFDGELVTPSSFSAQQREHFSEEAFEAYMDEVLSSRERGSTQMQSVGEWLESVGMAQYENQFITNGFDNLDFLGPNILEEQDLEQIKVLNHEHRKTILQAANHLPHLQQIDPSCPPSCVEEWLKSLQLLTYLETFTCHGYDTMEKVQSILWDLQLRTVLDISMLGHRKRILASLGDRSPDKVNNKRPSLSSLSPGEKSSKSSHLGDLDFYKDYTSVKPVSSSEEDIKETMAVGASSEEEEEVFRTGQCIRDSSIHVRPPHMAQTSSPAKSWRHRPEMLIKGCCNYTAQYLGSTIVPELTGGTQSTRAGITKLKKSTDSLAKIPIIMLSISYKGVKFIDAKTKKVICDHDISNIFCACQDTENLNFFAYITRDIESSHHYCHVFSVKSASLAHDIILTLGESFEVAYQIALKEKSQSEAMRLDRKMSQSDAEDTYSVSSKISTNTV